MDYNFDDPEDRKLILFKIKSLEEDIKCAWSTCRITDNARMKAEEETKVFKDNAERYLWLRDNNNLDNWTSRHDTPETKGKHIDERIDTMRTRIKV